MVIQITPRKSAIAAMALALVTGQPAIADGLNVGVKIGRIEADVSLGGTRERTQRTVTANVDGSVSRSPSGSDRRVVDSDTTVGISRTGVQAATCFNLFGNCPDQQASQNGGTPTGNPAVDPNANPATQQAARVSANRDGSVRRLSPGQSQIRGEDFVGIVLMSADRQVLGIVQSAEMQPDGTVLVTVQISATINAPRTITTLRFTPTSMPDQMITFGLTAQQFVNSLT